MEKNPKDRIPDLKFWPWRRNKIYDLKSEDGEIIGSYCEYIHELTSKFGVELKINGSDEKVIIWEESVVFGGKESCLRYIAHKKGDVWHKVRVSHLYPSRTKVEGPRNRRVVTVCFALVIKGETEVRFSIKN